MSLRSLKACGFISVIKTLCIKFLTLVLTLGIILLVPLVFLLLTLPFGTFRYLLHKSARYWRPDLGKMITLRGTVMAVDSMYTQPAANVVAQFNFEGTVDINRLKDTVTRNLLEGKLSNGELKYPELKQYLTSWLNYFFWKDDKTFDMDRHVKLQSVVGLSDAEILETLQTLVMKPWVKDKPLWEISLALNCHPNGLDPNAPHTVLFLRYHHTLADGFSMLKLVSEGLCEMKSVPQNVVPTYSQRSYCKSLLFSILLPFVGCYELAELFFESMSLRMATKLFTKERAVQLHIGMTDKIQIQRVKEIKNHFGVSFVSVVSAVCAGALRDILIIKGIKVPETFHCGTILPLPGHSGKLRNFLATGFLRLCMFDPDPVKRLQQSSKDYQRLKRSAIPALSAFLQIIPCSFPACIIRAATKETGPPSALTIFPGGFENLTVDGCKCVDTAGGGGLIGDGIGITFFALSYMDGLRITAAAKDSVMTQEELNEVVRLLTHHVDILYELMVKDV